ncbi:MAG: hypothetical protein DLM60_03165 [Pseudonocardiales bacterium]|nr:LysE family translocator [Actinomycetota bacterium]PZS23135.1 MAG: hypothetical protein DLM60_03165 [Pseudonocardiales bacterium]
MIAMVAPGPDMLFVVGCGMRGDPRAGLLATAGVATSEAVHIAVAAAGLTALIAAVPIAFTVVRIAGAAYLIYLGVQLIRHRNKGQGNIRGWLQRRHAARRRIDVATGGLFIGLGVRLAAER